MKQVLDVCGQPCPIPVVKAGQSLAGMTNGVLEVRVDNEVAVQNLSRLAAQKGLAFTAEQQGEKLYVATLTVTSPVAQDEAPVCCAPMDGAYVVAVDTACMGRGDEKLGKTLMKGFLYALSQQKVLPSTVLFYNGGAHLTVEGSESLEDLKAMEQSGVEVLTCGTCLDFYGIKEKLAVGSVTNMYAIVEKLTTASRVIKP
jgi:selenium metabolism protein YedF